MAETWARAFGRYLRTLRQRRGLSLQEVCSLSQAFAENVEKGYLSRCENGHQGPAFSKIIPLSRIYDVSGDVLLERLELDMELDRVGGPDTEGMSYEELTETATVAIEKGYSWTGYALIRDAIPRASVDPLKANFGSRDEQVDCAHMNCATAARRLGRRRFALHEYTAIDAAGTLGPRSRVILLERLSVSYRVLKRFERALKHVDEAISLAKTLEDFGLLGWAYSSRACLAFAQSDLKNAADFFQRAYDAFRQGNDQFACARSLSNLAQVFFDLGRLGAAKRSLAAAIKLAVRLDQPRVQALSNILLGEIDSAEHRETHATRRWREAADIARKLDDKVIRFKAEYFLYKQAQANGNRPVARSLQRRLRKLAHWIPDDTPELLDFRQSQQHASAS